MSATTAQQQPVVPPRPARSQDMPKVPPRPARRAAIERSVSPSNVRFAPSPLNEAQFPKSPVALSFAGNNLSVEPADRSGSVEMPSLGEEGLEYAAVTEELVEPEHTRTTGDLEIHAPKPSLPASSAKQRVATVTHTNSDKAASFGIGRASSSDEVSPPESTKKTASISSQELSDDLGDEDDKHGIPAIGRQVPMYPNAGDVQAPTPSSGAGTPESLPTKKSSGHKGPRSFGVLPPGSYGLHGHGLAPADKFEKAYYEKHPELVKTEHKPHHADRAKDFSMTSDELNKIVRETASHGAGVGTHDVTGTPSEQVGWEAIQESTSRPASVAPKGSFGSESSATASVRKNEAPEISVSAPTDQPSVIHVESHRKSVVFDDIESPDLELEDEAPILALDEIAKDPSAYNHEPAVEPPIERRLSSYDVDESSRSTSRPASIFKGSKNDKESDSAVADQEEYEPLFPKDDDQKPARPLSISAASAHGEEHQGRFPSRDVWEDAPSSAYHTAEVSAPDESAQVQQEENPEEPTSDVVPREGETPAQAFARHQEELAETELHGKDTFLENRKPRQPAPWTMQGSRSAQEASTTSAAGSLAAPAGATGSSRRPPMGQRFPSRDIWEDAPESLQLETTVSNPQDDESASPSPADVVKPEVPHRPIRKLTDPLDKAAPVVPSRPKPKGATVASPVEASGGASARPHVPERPKPHVPARPVKQFHPVSTDKEPEAAPRAKPAVPARPMGGKIAQLQASFMSDLNKKLKIGPQVHKKDEPVAATEEAAKEVEKAPLVDARKGRARGPQRRAPRSSPSPAAVVSAAAASASPAPISLGFSTTTTVFSIDPEEGILSVSEHVSEPVSAHVAEHGDVPAVAPVPEAEEPKEVVKPAAAEEKIEEAGEAETKEVLEKEEEEEPKAEPKAEEAEPVEESKTEEKTEEEDVKPEAVAAEAADKTLSQTEAEAAEESADASAVVDPVSKD